MKPIFSIPSHFLLANRPIPPPATYQIKRNVSTIKFRSSFFIYNKINENIRQFNQFLSFFKVIDSDILYISIWFRYFFPSFVSFVWSRVEKLNWLKDFDFPKKRIKWIVCLRVFCAVWVPFMEKRVIYLILLIAFGVKTELIDWMEALN